MKANILFIVPSLRRAGAETQLVELVNGLPDDKYEKHLFMFDHELDLKDRLRATIHFYYHPRHARFDLNLIRAIARLIDEKHIEIVHSTMEYALFNGWLAARLSRRKPAVLHAAHSTLSRNFKIALQEWLIYRHMMRACNRLIFVCENQKQYWIGRFPDLAPLAQVIHNGIDNAWFDPDAHHAARADFRRQHGLSEDAVVFSCIAGFRTEKGHHFLLEAFHSLCTQVPSAHLLLAGDGTERSAIENYIHNHGLGGRVDMLGNLSDVRPLLAASDCTILASTAGEAFSIAMLESLSMRVPMIATDIGGASEAILPEKTGLLVPPGDAAALGAAMLHLAADETLRRDMGKNGRELVAARFTRQHMIERTEAILDDVLGQPQA